MSVPGRTKSFDNRSSFRRAIMQLRGRQGYPHYLIQIRGKRILYCYIRKNACSAFKKMILAELAEEGPLSGEAAIDVMDRRFRARFPGDASGVDHALFVYRDPFERIASLYKNKFIQRDGAEEILRNFHETTGRNPETSTFADFVNLYLSTNFGELDLHVVPQRRHLLPIVYTDAIPISRLHESMVPILGDRLADRYFLKPTNATSHSDAEQHEPAHDRPAKDLRDRYRLTGRVPSTRSLLAPEIKERLAEIYREDMVFSD